MLLFCIKFNSIHQINVLREIPLAKQIINIKQTLIVIITTRIFKKILELMRLNDKTDEEM